MEQSIIPLADVAATLTQWATFAEQQIASAPIPEMLGHLAKSRQFSLMARSVRHAILGTVSAVSVVAEVKTKRAAKVAAKTAALGALAFWRLHGEAVERISAEYRPALKVRAPFGHTEIVALVSGLRSCVTERGTKLRWMHDHRMPAARYWPGGVLPGGVTVLADYPRSRLDRSGDSSRWPRL